MRPAPVALLALFAVVAGCTDPGSPAPQEGATPDAFEDVEVTDTTGAIRGVVVNEAIVPIADVLVALNTGKNVTSDEQGAFVFSDLEPGTYFLTASKLGFNSVQTSAEVVAGEAEPPITKITLLADPTQQPYTQTLKWEGFLQCGVMWSSGTLADQPYPLYIASYFGANVCGLTDDRFIGGFEFNGRIPDHVQANAVWDGTQPLSNDLTLGFWRGGSNDWKFVYGKSPLSIETNRTEIVDTFDENKTDLPMRMFPGQSDEPASIVVTTNQAFTVYQTQFYGFVPRAGWQFIVDGPCNTPEQCGA